MTTKAKELLDELERELNELPEDEQIECATSYLNDLRRRKEEDANGEDESLYEPFQIMIDADLDLPPDYSEGYEEHLYGSQKEDE
jgi:hypothetical protein